MITGLKRAALYSAIKILSVRQREIVSLTLAGNSSRDIAKILNLKSDGSVRKTRRRAYARLRKHMEVEK
jgi:DNA-binding CsgD family transcriptional regulator